MTSCKTPAKALLSFVALFSMAAGAEDNQPPTGFTSLFNGQDMSGWKADPEGHWTADGGVMVYDGKAKNLVSEQEFGDFVLLIDWKIPKGGNSGIFLRGHRRWRSGTTRAWAPVAFIRRPTSR